MELVLNEPQFNSTEGFYRSDVKSMKIRTPEMRYLGGEESMIYLEFLPNNNELYKIIKSVDEQILKQLVKNGKSWFGNELSYDTVERLLVPSINLPVNLKSYPYVIFETNDNVQVYDKIGETIDVSDLKPDNEVSVTFYVDHVIFHQNKFEIVYIVEKIEILNNVCQSKRCTIDDNSDNDDSELDFVNSVTL